MPEIHGNVEGIRKSVLDRLSQWYDLTIPTDAFMPQDLLSQLCGYSASVNREIALYITRYGEIAEIIIGKADSVDLPDVRLRRSNQRLSMIRCIHTHPSSTGELSDVDLSALHTMRFDAMCSVGVDKQGKPTTLQAAFLDPSAQDGVRITGLLNARKLPDEEWLQTIMDADAAYVAQDIQLKPEPERAVLVGLESGESRQELGELARSAGAQTVAVVLQKRPKPDPLYCVGKGKAQELALQCQALRADVVIVDEELTGVMQKNLEEVLRVKVVDRTTLILDIFASRANTREGKIQVEMAQLQYRSQRLLGQGLVLSRLAGGIGTRGPGESKLEVNRRRIRERLTDLKRELEQVEKQRGLRRQQREKSQIPLVALVGYTNAGKSTLFNRLTGSLVYVEDQLFATLDSVSRPIVLPHGGKALLVDTVGFIRKLPHELVKAFRATLEEAALADVNVIVSDAAAPELMQQHATVLEVLDSLGATSAPRIDALNKSDLGATGQEAFPGAVVLSAKTGEGVGQLLAAIEERLEEGMQTVKLLIPFTHYGLLSKLHGYGSVLRQDHGEEGVTVILRAKAQYVKNAYEEGALPLDDEHS